MSIPTTLNGTFPTELTADIAVILDAVSDGVYATDASGIGIFVNRAAATMLGYEPRELIGTVLHDVIHHTRADGSPYPRSDCSLMQGREGGEGRREELFWRRNGTSFPVECECRPFLRADVVAGFVVCFRDVSARYQTEDRIRSVQRERVAAARIAALVSDVSLALTRSTSLATILDACARAVVTNLDAAFARIWTLDDTGQVLELRASAGMYTHLNGPHGRVPVGRYKIGLIAQQRAPHLTNNVIGDPRVGNQEWARREGMRAFAGYPLMVGDELVGVLAMFARHTLSRSDLQALSTVANTIALGIQHRRIEGALRTRADDLARLAEALERSNAELDAFAYAASHDLRAPLRGIANLAQWIEEDLTAGGSLRQETHEMLDLMRSRMHRMEALIEGILQYSRAGRIAQPAERIETRALVQDVIDLMAVPEGVTIEVGELPVIHSAPLPLQQVFMNLIGNALKHADRPDPVVRVQARDAGPFVEFSVADNGPGIPAEYHDRIWGMFQTLEARDKVEGTGIGLSLVKKLVESQGGRAWVESSGGDGATFRFLWRKTARQP